MCDLADEDEQHFILDCPETYSARNKPLKSLIQYCRDNAKRTDLSRQRDILLRAIMDCTHPEVIEALNLKPVHTVIIERISQQLIYKLHQMRTQILRQKAEDRACLKAQVFE